MVSEQDQEHDQEHEHDARLEPREGPHGEGAHSFYFHGDREESDAAIGNGGQAAHVLDDGNAGAEQRGVNGPGAVVGGVDVEGIDADKGYAGFDESFGQFTGEMRMAFEVLIGAPMGVPAGVEENGFPAHSRRLER